MNINECYLKASMCMHDIRMSNRWTSQIQTSGQHLIDCVAVTQ